MRNERQVGEFGNKADESWEGERSGIRHRNIATLVCSSFHPNQNVSGDANSISKKMQDATRVALG